MYESVTIELFGLTFAKETPEVSYTRFIFQNLYFQKPINSQNHITWGVFSESFSAHRESLAPVMNECTRM